MASGPLFVPVEQQVVRYLHATDRLLKLTQLVAISKHLPKRLHLLSEFSML